MILLRKIVPLIGTVLMATVLGRAQEIVPAAPRATPDTNSVTITVQPGPRQTFAGLGASCGNWGRDYQKLTTLERRALSRLLWRELNMKSLRLWLNLNEYAPTPGIRLTKEFRERYIESGLIADAATNGVVDLLLAPDNAPDYMKLKREGGPNDFAIKDEALNNYAALIADFIQQIKEETGVLINVTGVQNEPNDLDRIAPAQFPAVIKALRASLDSRGLQSVRIIAPESANVDSVFYDTLDRLQADPKAVAALDGIASHSYNMGATTEAARYLEGFGKSYWMTEASANGPEASGEAVHAASLASRFLSDMNQRTTHWIHFLGFEVPDPNDNATRIIAFSTNPLRTTIFQKYYYYQQLAAAFDVGAVFRKSQSSREGDMTWTYGPKPRLTVAAARNPDGSWSLGISNFTAPAFAAQPDNSGYYNGFAAQTFNVTVRLPELAQKDAVVFAVRRSSGHLNNAEDVQLVMLHGVLTVPNVAPLELVTVRSTTPGVSGGGR